MTVQDKTNKHDAGMTRFGRSYMTYISVS